MDNVKFYAALTFDDGPNTVTTPKILDILEKNNITASFFLVGNNITPESGRAVKRAYDMGCQICNHSKTHSVMPDLTAEEIRKEVRFVSQKVKEITGGDTAFFRPPYIAADDKMYDNIDMPFICGLGCDDWDDGVSVGERVERTLGQLTDGAIILLHDSEGNDKTVEAVKILVPEMKKRGYGFVTVSRLFEIKGVTPVPHERVLYSVVK
ncbi:MAG: polysaccharide deacetylase family protein [Ruminococcus sp.]|nr:polysaccharide deacetylase family protein [Ruminococcus sp.]